MEQKMEFKGKHPRRKFLAGFLTALTGAAALLLVPKRARAAAKKPTEPSSGPIYYRRTEEAERYYRTLY